MAIRVLRLIEYVYENEEVAEADMARWTHSHNWGRTRMRSSSLPFEAVDWDPPPMSETADPPRPHHPQCGNDLMSHSSCRLASGNYYDRYTGMTKESP